MASPASDPAAAVPHLEAEEPAAVAVAAVDVEKEAAEGEEEEEGECGFCLYMKGGGCKEAFVAWEECVEAAGKEEGADIVERCFEVTANLKKCMDAHADYYAPVLRAEQAVNDHADAAIAADKTKEGEEEKLDAVAQEAASAADEKKQEVEERSSSSSPATIDERKAAELVTEKADS